MDGVEILATGTRLSEFEPSAPAFVIVLAISMIIGLTVGVDEKSISFGLGLGIVLGFVGGFIIACLVGLVTLEEYPTYKVVISDTVSMNEFMDRYEIINQDGKIYTVKERTPNVD